MGWDSKSWRAPYLKLDLEEHPWKGMSRGIKHMVHATQLLFSTEMLRKQNSLRGSKITVQTGSSHRRDPARVVGQILLVMTVWGLDQLSSIALSQLRCHAFLFLHPSQTFWACFPSHNQIQVLPFNFSCCSPVLLPMSVSLSVKLAHILPSYFSSYYETW